jgi:predicted O-methyltransferase YrrM
MSRIKEVIRGFHYILIQTGIPARFVIAKLKRGMSKCCSIEDYVNISFKRNFPFRGWSIRPLQIKEEITELLKIVGKRKPRSVLETGTSRGGTLFLFSRVASSDATLITIDLLGYARWRLPLYKSFASTGQKLCILRMDSHKETTLNVIQKILSGHPLDLLFIDGDHTYEGVKKDFEMYHKLVRSGGIIAFHDIVPGLPKSVGGVPKFWDEIKRNFHYTEHVKNWKQGGCGIGVIYV